MGTKLFRIVIAGLLMSACGPTWAQLTETTVENGRGPVQLVLPASYDESQPLPLIVALHGYTSNSDDTTFYFDLVSQIDSRPFLYMAPDGNVDTEGNPFWNATDACCDFNSTQVDDSTYLQELVNIVRSQYSVDEQSIHFIGVSNGGFMSYRMACDHSDWIASIVSQAGATFLDDNDCAVQQPVHILQIHGTEDETILYDGGCIFGICYPSALETLAKWASINGCNGDAQPVGQAFNLDFDIAGDETTTVTHDGSCIPGGSADLWTMQDSPHVPNLPGSTTDENQFAVRTVDWLLSHRKPKSLSADIEGLWFDSSRAGEGYNIVATPSGILIFFYGYVNGERFWLISETIGDSFQFGLPVDIQMRAGPTGSGALGTPVDPSALQDWGTLTLEFTGCTSASATLSGNDGSVEAQLSLLAPSSGNNCASR